MLCRVQILRRKGAVVDLFIWQTSQAIWGKRQKQFTWHRERGEKKDANSLPIKLAFVYTTADKKEPDFGMKRLKQKLPRRVSVIAPILWLLII